MITLVIILLVLVSVVVLVYALAGSAPEKQAERLETEEWEYGDVWKEEPHEQKTAGAVQYIEIMRGDTGMGYDDSFMIDLVGYLGSRGIRATYDFYSVASEVGAIKTYVLKVETGKEKEATALLKEKPA